MKNKIILWVDKIKVELYDFTKVDHYVDDDRKYYIRVLCGSRFYYYPLALTSIGEIEIYENDN